MKIKLPLPVSLKRLAVTRNNDIIPLLLNDVDMDHVFSLLAERCIRHGKVSSGRDKVDFEIGGKYNLEKSLIPALSRNPKMQDFDTEIGREALLNWSKASVFNFKTEGKTKKGEQVDTMKLLSIASYRAALPKKDNRSSSRGVDEAIYRSLFQYMESLEGCEKPAHEIHSMFVRSSLAVGVDFKVNDWMWPEPKFNESDEIDINTLLQLRILEEFEPVRVDDKPVRNRGISSEPLALFLLQDLSRDLFSIINLFGDKSAPELLLMLRSIFALHLHRLPIRLSRTFDPVLGADSKKSTEMFFDFTQRKNSASARLSNLSIRDDLATASTLVYKQIYIGAALDFVKQRSSLLKEYLALNSEDHIQYLINISKSDAAERHAYELVQELINAVEEIADEVQKSEFLLQIDQAKGESNFEHLVNVILLEMQDRGLEATKKWLKAVAGLKKTSWNHSVFVVSGNLKSPEFWNYAMSDAVLNTLLELCYVKDNGTLKRSPALSLQEVFETLRNRWGIVINQSLPNFDSAEFDQAANENTIAFKARIKQMGWFAALSDDENAQYIVKPKGAEL